MRPTGGPASAGPSLFRVAPGTFASHPGEARRPLRGLCWGLLRARLGLRLVVLTCVMGAVLAAMGVTAQQTSLSDSRSRHIPVPLTPITARTTLGALVVPILRRSDRSPLRQQSHCRSGFSRDRGILVIRSFLPWRRHHSALTGRHEGARSRLKPLPQCNYQRSREFSDGSGGGECMLLLFSSPCPGAPKRKPAQPTANARAPSTNPNTAAQRAPRFTQEPHQPDKRQHPEGQLTATPDPPPRSSPAWRTGSPTGCRPAAATAPPIAPPPAAGRGFRPRPRPGRGSAGCPGPSPAA